MVNSETLPRRAPTRPALSIGGGGFRNLRRQLLEYVLQRLFPHFRRVGEQFPQLPDFLLRRSGPAPVRLVSVFVLALLSSPFN